MSYEVRAALERQLSSLLGTALPSVPVLPGEADSPRPDRFVSVVALDAEQRGSASLVQMEIRAVAPIDANAVATLQRTFRAVSEWARDPSSPLHGYTSPDEDLVIYGVTPFSQRGEIKERQRAEILSFSVGAQAF